MQVHDRLTPAKPCGADVSCGHECGRYDEHDSGDCRCDHDCDELIISPNPLATDEHPTHTLFVNSPFPCMVFVGAVQ